MLASPCDAPASSMGRRIRPCRCRTAPSEAGGHARAAGLFTGYRGRGRKWRGPL